MSSVCASRAYQVCVVIPIKRTFVAWRAVRSLRCSRCPRSILIGEVFTRGSHMRPVCRHCASFGAWPEDDRGLRIGRQSGKRQQPQEQPQERAS